MVRLGLEHNYEEGLSAISNSNPLIYKILLTAHNNRTARLREYSFGTRFKGLEELLEYFVTVEQIFQETDTLSKLAFLIGTARADFEVSVEALMSGMDMVVLDSMRDV